MELPRAVLLTPHWNDEDFNSLLAMAQRLRAQAADLLIVLYSESGLRPDAAARDPFGFPIAVGLNQLTPIAAKALGITESERRGLLHRTVVEQLPYVERYFASLTWTQQGHSYESAAQVYQANAAPATMHLGAAPEVVLYRKGDGNYEGNAALDTAHKGTVTVGDLAAVLTRRLHDPVFEAALTRLHFTHGSSSKS